MNEVNKCTLAQLHCTPTHRRINTLHITRLSEVVQTIAVRGEFHFLLLGAIGAMDVRRDKASLTTGGLLSEHAQAPSSCLIPPQVRVLTSSRILQIPLTKNRSARLKRSSIVKND